MTSDISVHVMTSILSSSQYVMFTHSAAQDGQTNQST